MMVLRILFIFCTLTKVNSQFGFEDIYDSNEEDLLETLPSYLSQGCKSETVHSDVLRVGKYFDENCNCYNHGEYYEKYEIMVCDRIMLETDQHIPLHPNTNTFKYIRFENSVIPTVPVGDFMKYTNLTELYLNNSFVKSVHPGAFTGLTNLRELYLQDNQLVEISKGMFNSLPNLEILSLSNNSLMVIEENTFLGLFSIRNLDLADNKLENLRVDIFKKLHSLDALNLSNNLLSSLPANLFKDTFMLGSLKLSYNKLTYLAFVQLPINLKYLKLDHNYINNLTNISLLINLLELDINSNNITKLDILPINLMQINVAKNKITIFNQSLFSTAKLLKSIDFSNNLLSNLNENSFVDLHHLRYLNLSYNQLRNVPVGCFRNLNLLDGLDISNNLIDELEYGTFAGLDDLKVLDISSNKLSYLYESSFHNLKNLNSLSIANNLITSFDPHDLLAFSKHLATVSLENNPWICKSLLNVIHEFENLNIVIQKGSVVKSEHVHGISCLKNKPENNYFSDNKENSSLEYFNKTLKELYLLKNFFNADFQNSNFYSFFKNFGNVSFDDSKKKYESAKTDFLKSFNDLFINTSLYRMLNQNFSFLGNIEKDILQLSEELKSINSKIQNFSVSNLTAINVTKSFSEYFDNGFKNSSFYTYLNKDFSNSEFTKYFNKILPNKIDSSISKIQNYWDNGIKNSSLYNLLNNSIWNEVNLTNTKLEPHVSHLKGDLDYLHDAELVAKIASVNDNIKLQQDILRSVKVGTTIFMIIIVILLSAITLLFAYNYTKIGFKKNVNISSAKVQAESRTNITDAAMELL